MSLGTAPNPSPSPALIHGTALLPPAWLGHCQQLQCPGCSKMPHNQQGRASPTAVGLGAVCCHRKPGRYLPSAAIFLSCTHSFPCAEQLALCDRIGVNKRERIPFPKPGGFGGCAPLGRGGCMASGSLGASLGPALLPGSPIEERCPVIHPLVWEPEPVPTTDVPVCLWVCFALCLLLTAARRMFIAEDGMDETSPLQPKLRVLSHSFSPQQQMEYGGNGAQVWAWALGWHWVWAARAVPGAWGGGSVGTPWEQCVPHGAAPPHHVLQEAWARRCFVTVCCARDCTNQRVSPPDLRHCVTKATLLPDCSLGQGPQ